MRIVEARRTRGPSVRSERLASLREAADEAGEKLRRAGWDPPSQGPGCRFALQMRVFEGGLVGK
jgi:hypothetical protein